MLLRVFIYTLVVVSLGLISACDPGNVSIEGPIQLSGTYDNPHEDVGIMHNLGLAYQYNHLVGLRAPFESLGEALQFAEDEGTSFMFATADGDLSQQESRDVVYAGIYPAYEITDFSQKVQEYYDDISNIIENSYSVYDVQFELNTLLGQALNERWLSDDPDRLAILSAISVAGHSYEYWHDNADDWKAAIGDVGTRSTDNTWREVVHDDVAGAIMVGGRVSSHR